MCGIVGYVGGRPCRDLLVAGLEKLEYRGYDSAGLSVIADGEIDSVRAVGNLANLRAAVERSTSNGDGPVAVAAPPATTGLAHTRWATHGRVTEENAHPHGDCSDAIHIVLNGIVENHAELRRELRGRGPPLQLRDRRRDRRPPDRAPLRRRPHRGGPRRLRRAARPLRLRRHARRRSPDTLVGGAQGVPAGRRRRRGRDLPRLGDPRLPRRDAHARSAIENGEIVTIAPGRRDDHRRRRATPVERDAEEVTWDEDAAEKGGYETFMLKEIHEQADAVAETIADRLPDDRRGRPLRRRARRRLPARASSGS